MSKKIRAVYQRGVFRPLHPVSLPDNCEVEFEPQLVEGGAAEWESVYSVLSERYDSGDADVAARHDEHQP